MKIGRKKNLMFMAAMLAAALGTNFLVASPAISVWADSSAEEMEEKIIEEVNLEDDFARQGHCRIG